MLRSVSVVALLLGLIPLPARAAGRRTRPLFEPTDLELEDPGWVEIDLQTGFVQSQGEARLVIPDLELDIGLFRAVELDLDAGYALAVPPAGPISFDHAGPDSLWGAAKIGIFSVGDDGRGAGLGLQLGPKLPVAPGSHGLGAEGLALIGLRKGHTHVAINLGAFVDPAPAAQPSRPRGLEGGVDLDLDLDPAARWSVTAELGGVRFLSADPHELTATAGLAFALSERLELSLAALAGLLAGGDRWGLLVGVSPRISLR